MHVCFGVEAWGFISPRALIQRISGDADPAPVEAAAQPLG